MMKKVLSVFLLLAFVNLYTPVFATSETTESINIPANTSIFIKPIETVTSKDMTIDAINGTIANDVIVDGNIIFKSGAKATLHIGEIQKARCWGNPGKLVVVNGFAYDVNGEKHKIVITRNYYGEERAWTKTVGVVSIFFLWPLALFGFVHGGQATVSSGAEIETNLASQFEFKL